MLATLCAPIAPAQSTPSQSRPARLRTEWLTGDAAGSVTADGRWIFPRPRYEVLSPERVRYVLTPHTTSATRPVQPREPVAPCGPLYYVESVYEPFSRSADSTLQMSFGPHYVVPLCAADGSIGRVVELADAIDRVWGSEPGGTPIVGPDETWPPLSSLAEDGLPVSPERATAFVVERTQARVDRVPEAVAYLAERSSMQNVPTCMRWHLHLDRPVRLRTESGARRVTRDVWVNRALPCYRGAITLYVPIEPQPATIDLPYRRRPDRTLVEPRPKGRVARPAFFESATVERPVYPPPANDHKLPAGRPPAP